jgi:hypothetical protein
MEERGKVVRMADFRRKAKAGRSGAGDEESGSSHPQLRQVLEELLTDGDATPPVKKPARKRAVRATRPPAGRVLTQTARGIGNVQVAGNLIIQTAPIARRTPAPAPVPGEGELTNEQAAEIKRLVGVVVAHSGQSWPHVYGTLTKRMEATSYLMIKRYKYGDAVAYLHKWIASVTATPARSESSEEQRKRFLKRIHAQARKQGGTMDKIHAYIRGRFGTPSLADLAPGQLQEVIKEFRL